MYLLKYIEKAEKIMRKTYTIFLCHVWGHPLTTWKHFLGIFDPPHSFVDTFTKYVWLMY